MNGFERLIPFAVFAAYVGAAALKARRRRAPRMVADVRSVVPPAPVQSAQAAPRRTLPVARLPERAPAAPATPASAGASAPGRAAGPRWAANAIIAAEVFGPPLAARPGGTLGPPNAL